MEIYLHFLRSLACWHLLACVRLYSWLPVHGTALHTAGVLRLRSSARGLVVGQGDCSATSSCPRTPPTRDPCFLAAWRFCASFSSLASSVRYSYRTIMCLGPRSTAVV